MKNIFLFYIAALFFSLSFTSCDKNKTEDILMTVNRNCTGTYLQVDDKEHLVCNPEVLMDIPVGTSILIDYTPINDCITPGVICQLAYYHDGGIQVDEFSEL